MTLSPIWLRFYFLDQFDVDIFSSHFGYVLSTMTLATGLLVFRYAPGGDGPMELYMVVSSDALPVVCYFDILVLKRSTYDVVDSPNQILLRRCAHVPGFFIIAGAANTFWLRDRRHVARFHRGQARRNLGALRHRSGNTLDRTRPHGPGVRKFHTRPRCEFHIVEEGIIHDGDDRVLRGTDIQPLRRTRIRLLGADEEHRQGLHPCRIAS